jgi:hypothetical protein
VPRYVFASKLPLLDDFRIPLRCGCLIYPWFNKYSTWLSMQSAISLKLLDFLFNNGNFVATGVSSCFRISSCSTKPFFNRAWKISVLDLVFTSAGAGSLKTASWFARL